MILDDESTKSLRKFLIKTLEPICDADPPVLANYVIALLHNDKPKHELQDSCIQELEDFLKEETKPFVNKLFDALKEIESKQFVHLSPANSNDREYERDDEDRDHKHTRRDSPEGDRKRSYSGDEDYPRRKSNGAHTTEDSAPSRRRRDDEEDDRRHFDKPRHNKDSRDDRYAPRENTPRENAPRENAPPPRENFRRYGEFNNTRDRPYFDGSGRGGRSDRGGRYGGPNNPPPPPPAFRPRPRQRCRDYDERGFCVRGELCTFDHGADRIIVSDMQEFQKLQRDTTVPSAAVPVPVPLPTIPPFPVNPEVETYAPQIKRPKFERRYDPTDMAPYNPESPMFGNLVPLTPTANWNQPPFDSRVPSGRGKPPRFQKAPGIPEDTIPLNPTVPYYNNNSNFQNNNSIVIPPTHNFSASSTDKRVVVEHTKGQTPSAAVELGPSDADKRKPFNPAYNNNSNPNFSKSQTTLLITNIPPDLNSIDKLNSHFKKFGTVVNLQVKFTANKAFVQFTNHAEALRAYRAVDAVLGNRFIKVFWANRPDDQGPESGTAPSKPDGPFSHKPVAFEAKPSSSVVSPTSTPTPVAQPTPAPTPAPTAPSSTAKELQERKQHQIEQTKKLLDMLATKLKTVGPKEKEELLQSMKTTTKHLEDLLKKDIIQQAAKPKVPATPVQQPVKVTKAQKEKERLDRELDQISSAAPTGLQSSTSSLTSSTSSLGESSSSIPAPQPTATPAPTTTTTTTTSTTTTANSPSLSHLQELKRNLEEKALSMGLDTSSVRGRGRGRGAPRGRGGRGRGRGGVAAGSGMTLDNRSTTLSIAALPSDLRTENALRIHFQPFGDISSIVVQGDSATVQFATRRFAEAAFTQARQYKTHKLNIAWLEAPKAFTSSTGAQPTASEQQHDEDSPMPDVEHPQHARQQEEEEEEDEDEGAERSWKH